MRDIVLLIRHAIDEDANTSASGVVVEYSKTKIDPVADQSVRQGEREMTVRLSGTTR
jgi:hypothetical protein